MIDTSASKPRPAKVVICLGVAQIVGWGTSFYFPAVLAAPIVADTGWPLGGVVGGVSIGLLVGGLISPHVGRAIERYGGRPVLVLSSLLFAAGLAGVALAPILPVYLAAWAVVGLGSGLYDAAFAALGTIYGKDARTPITNLTLFGGFASTVCWPLGAALVDAYGWRATSLIYAAIHLVIALPMQFIAIPSRTPPAEANSQRGPAYSQAKPEGIKLNSEQRTQFALLALVLTISSAVGAIVIVHLLIFLQARGLSFSVAVSLGTLFGPAQVGVRMIESLFGRHYHPIWTMVASCTLMAIGLLLLLLIDLPFVAVAILLYGGGYGIMWIARGTLPLALFGPERYASLIGRLALPALIAQALAPSAGAMLLERTSASFTIAMLAGCAAVNVVLVTLLWGAARQDRETPAV